MLSLRCSLGALWAAYVNTERESARAGYIYRYIHIYTHISSTSSSVLSWGVAALVCSLASWMV